MGSTTNLHASVLQVSIDEWDPGGRLEGVEGRGVQVGVVLVPGDGCLLVVWSLGTDVPDRMAWGHRNYRVLYVRVCVNLESTPCSICGVNLRSVHIPHKVNINCLYSRHRR